METRVPSTLEDRIKNDFTLGEDIVWTASMIKMQKCGIKSLHDNKSEQIHVATNSLVCADMGLTPSKSLDKLRKATINWIMEPLGKNTYGDKYLSKKFWLDSSDNLMYNGKAPELSETRAARMPSFFEHSNVNLPQYS